MIIKREKNNKDVPKNKKLFTKEELNETLEVLKALKSQIVEKRDQLNAMTKQNDLKVSKLLAQNRQVEADFRENEKLNKMLIFKRNELKRNIKNISVNGPTSNLVKQKYKINLNKLNIKNNNKIINNEMNNKVNNNEINDNHLENELENDAEFHEPENTDMNENDEQPKLFGKNPNKKKEDNNEEMENMNNGEEAGNENIEQDNDAIENDNMNDSNLNIDENNMNNDDIQGES